jgi:predicted DCC family thiol-disulfide oxidoreductase YuxK
VNVEELRSSKGIIVVFFDSSCLICNRFVLFLLEQDKAIAVLLRSWPAEKKVFWAG